MTTRRVIRKNGWLYWLAYAYRQEKDRPTGKVNLCDTVWLAIRNLIAAFSLLVIVTLGAIGILFTLWYSLLGVWLVVQSIIEWLAHSHLPTMPKETTNMFLIGAGLWVSIVAFAWGLAFGLPALIKSETWRLWRAYLRAKKEKVCPIFEVV